jgi:hypothetical protein
MSNTESETEPDIDSGVESGAGSTVVYQDKDVTVELEDGCVKKTVYRLNHSGFKRNVPPDEMVEREARALKMVCNIPHVQQFVRMGDSPEIIYSEYMAGTKLAEYKGTLPGNFLDDLEASLRQCRKRGVFRLDRFLKPERDIVVRPDLTPGIIDFGDILFFDDPVARIPGIKPLLEAYSKIQMIHLKRTFKTGP